MKASLLGIDLVAKKATIVDSGDEPFSTTNLALIGQAVAGILKKPEETANKYLSEYYAGNLKDPKTARKRGTGSYCIGSQVVRYGKRLTWSAVISSFTTTQNEILRVAEDLSGVKFETKHITAAEAEKSADDNLSSGKAYEAFWDYVRQYQFADGAGHALRGDESANTLFGLKQGDLVDSMKSILADV